VRCSHPADWVFERAVGVAESFERLLGFQGRIFVRVHGERALAICLRDLPLRHLPHRLAAVVAVGLGQQQAAEVVSRVVILEDLVRS